MIKLTTPLSNSNIEHLHIGDEVLFTGTIFTARDAAHEKLVNCVKEHKELPFEPTNAIIYYVGPTPPKPHQALGSAGPTSSYRMDPYSLVLMEQGIKVMIGKGDRSESFKTALVQNKAVYLSAIGGTGALLSKTIKKAQLIAYPELGPEGIYRLEVEDFPAIVTYDCYGGDLFITGQKQYAR
ncbi:MAG: FumA C-terminus/TtdB family hydratase beta subunit [Bacilli bacterium]